ncbi:MAG: tetratricopeptide repeat protein [Gammaproteobacteria bacterium]|nr:tetratricopeptide repeat protein [Gammaproteobacteria bacterium]MBT8109171.1 tetratricopeptide repeat protein [Gammaproteobacteria bacterium]NND47851.1 tetratricopeptide repeat protein [Woeseiaceae bacterium]NNL43874.1 tetratricopeptide repeat protein [Woeseiaceae bacterium]
MHELRRWPSAAVLITLFALTITPAIADEAKASDASAHILQAEMALQRKDYLEATIAYRKAAEISNSAETARKATTVAFAYRFDDEALKAAKRWVKLDPDSDEAAIYLAQSYFRVNDLRRAQREFRSLVEKGEEAPGHRLVSMIPYLSEEGDPQNADKLMRALAKPYKNSSLAHYAAAILALEAGDTEHAMQRALRSSELDPDNVKPKLLYARALLIQGSQDEAIEYTARIIGDDPDPDPDARMELAIMYMMAGRDDDALSQVNQVLLEQSGRADALRLMAIINFRQEYLDAAWDDFQDLLATGQYRMDALYYLARIADYREEFSRAILLYSEVRYGGNAVASQRRASALLAFQGDDVDGAVELLDEFGESSPSHAIDMMLAKAQLFASLEQFERSLELYDQVVEFRPDDEGTALSRAELLLRMEKLDDALDAYSVAVKRWPKSALSLNAYGYTLADRTDRFAEAEKLIQKAIRLDPDNPAIIDSLGWVFYKLGRLDEALTELQRAYDGFDDHEVAAHLVEVLVAMDRRAEARELLDAALEKRPDSSLLDDARSRFFPDSP